mmetsp:Transcript_24143/g.50564  ORF Transcript_24143/g.50564 Transcript_24143/m.50564 type:complete len:151 (+) Transcript_24143:77-529(+)
MSLPTILENISETMDYTTLNIPSTPNTRKIYPFSDEYLKDNLCPSTPHPRKMKVTIQDKHVFVPAENSGASTKCWKIPIVEFPSLPFCNVPSAAPTPIESDNGAQLRHDLDSTSTDTSQRHSKNKLPGLERNQSLSHFNRRRKSFGARCA